MNVDTDMLAVAVLIGGIILFTVANRKEVVQVEQNPYGQVPMETDELVATVDKEKVKRAQYPGGGDLPSRVQAIAKYIVTTSQFMLQLHKYFEDNFKLAGGRNVAWLRQAYPDEYDRLQQTMAYCEARDIEFRQLWHELSQNWLAANQNYLNIPRRVINDLKAYDRVDINDIQNYTQNQVNNALFQFKAMAIRAMAQQAQNFMEWQDMTQKQMDREQNNQAMDLMEDENGQWLMENPLDDGTIRFQQVRNLEWRDKDGVARARQVVDEIHLPQHMMQSNDNGQGWGGTGYDQQHPGKTYQDNNTQQYGQQPWASTNPNGRREITPDQARDMLAIEKGNLLRLDQNNHYNNPNYGPDDVNLKHDHSEDDDPRNSTSTYNTTNASSIRPQDTMPLSPYQNEFLKQQISQQKSLDHLTDELAGLKETVKASVERATDFAEASPPQRVAEATVNLLNEPQQSYIALEQVSPNQGVIDEMSRFVTSPRGKRMRSDSMAREAKSAELGVGTISDKSSAKKPMITAPPDDQQQVEWASVEP